MRLVLTDEREVSFAFSFLKRMSTKNIDSKFLKSKTGRDCKEGIKFFQFFKLSSSFSGQKELPLELANEFLEQVFMIIE